MDKRTFVFYVASRNPRRNLPGYNLKISIHEIVNNLPTMVGMVSVNTASYKGKVSEVMNHLVSEVMNHLGRNGYIDSSFADGYYKENDSFQIVRI